MRCESSNRTSRTPHRRSSWLRASRTLISAGTEQNLLEGDHRAAGLTEAPDALRPGYSWVGRVVSAGADTSGFAEGDRIVASLPHVSAALIPQAARQMTRLEIPQLLPDAVSDDAATFVSLADVALHAVRRAHPGIGDAVAVYGVGVVGQLIVQLARMAGAYPVVCRGPRRPEVGGCRGEWRFAYGERGS